MPSNFAWANKPYAAGLRVTYRTNTGSTKKIVYNLFIF